MKKCFCLLLIIALVLLNGVPAQASKEIPWSGESYSHFSRNESLKNFLTHFVRSQGINAEISDNIGGNISGYFDQQDPEQLFRWLVEEYDITHYYDGDVLHIYHPKDLFSNSYYLETVSGEYLLRKLRQFALYEEKFIRLEGEQTVFVQAPLFYIRKVENIIRELDNNDAITVRVFYLKHAWADDREFKVRGQSVNVPGAATILDNLLTGGGGDLKVRQDPNKVQSELMQNISQIREKQLVSGIHAVQQDERSRNTAVATVEAYPRLNALIIRDYANKMPLYEKIVALLDVPMPLVEISVSIVDVDVHQASELGIDWSGGLGGTASEADSNEIASPGGLLTAGLGKMLGTNVTIPQIKLEKIFSQIRWLEKNGRGRISSQPKVLTTSNVEAMLDYSQTFYVRVGDSEASNIVPVTVGTLLRVTPQVIDTDHGKRIRLDVEIEDGNVINKTELQVDNIPRVIKTSISTHASIAENETLLIGGYHHDQVSFVRSGVPLLSKIPLLGLFFQHEQDSVIRLERIFIITPRIIELPFAPKGASDGDEKLKEDLGG